VISSPQQEKGKFQFPCIEELKNTGRGPSDGMPQPIFRSDVQKMEDLEVCMVLTGNIDLPI